MSSVTNVIKEKSIEGLETKTALVRVCLSPKKKKKKTKEQF